jgi:hypothetical protein
MFFSWVETFVQIVKENDEVGDKSPIHNKAGVEVHATGTL